MPRARPGHPGVIEGVRCIHRLKRMCSLDVAPQCMSFLADGVLPVVTAGSWVPRAAPAGSWACATVAGLTSAMVRMQRRNGRLQ